MVFDQVSYCAEEIPGTVTTKRMNATAIKLSRNCRIKQVGGYAEVEADQTCCVQHSGIRIITVNTYSLYQLVDIVSFLNEIVVDPDRI